MQRPKRDPRFFEKWAAKNCMKPVCKVDHPDGEILLADSIEPIRVLGKFRCGYAIHRNGMEIGNYHDYDMREFILYSRAGGVQKRVNEALANARQVQTMLKESGFYDDSKKQSFSQRPN